MGRPYPGPEGTAARRPHRYQREREEGAGSASRLTSPEGKVSGEGHVLSSHTLGRPLTALGQGRNYLEPGRKEETGKPELVSVNLKEEKILRPHSQRRRPDEEEPLGIQVSDREEDTSQEIQEKEAPSGNGPASKGTGGRRYVRRSPRG